jgi:hypothetical protein
MGRIPKICPADAWTGTRVAIYWNPSSPSNGKVKAIMNPADGHYYPYDDLFCAYKTRNSCGMVTTSILNDFNTLLPTKLDGKTPSYETLNTFTFTASGANPTGWVEVLIK